MTSAGQSACAGQSSTDARCPRPPRCLTGFLVADVDVESEDDEQSHQSCPPVDDKHDHTAQDGPRERHPHVVVLEAGAPA